MQVQTTWKRYSSPRKLLGGLLIAALVAVGAISLAAIGNLAIPGTGGRVDTSRPTVIDAHVGPRHGEGLPLSIERSSPASVPRPSMEQTRFWEMNLLPETRAIVDTRAGLAHIRFLEWNLILPGGSQQAGYYPEIDRDGRPN